MAKIANAKKMMGTKKASLRLLQAQRGFKKCYPNLFTLNTCTR
jgi:hypothetical protein